MFFTISTGSLFQCLTLCRSSPSFLTGNRILIQLRNTLLQPYILFLCLGSKSNLLLGIEVHLLTHIVNLLLMELGNTE